MFAVPLKQLQTETTGHLIGESVPLNGLAIDSRVVRQGDLFAAIRGARVDGHQFAGAALRSGAAALLTERVLEGLTPQLVVADVVRAVGSFGRLKRASFQGDVIAITGSAGKTTTKNLLAAALSSQAEVLATKGNQNNELGVPLTLSGLQAEYRYAVVEMGARKSDDITQLCNIASPTVAVCLNASAAHLAHFKTPLKTAETKGEILLGLKGRGIAVMNADQSWLPIWQEQAGKAHKVTFGLSEYADYRALDIRHEGLGATSFQLQGPGVSVRVDLRLAGTHHVMNALAALAVSFELGLDPELVIKRILHVKPESGRGCVISSRYGGRIVDDCYNANPAAVKAAIDVLSRQPGQRVLILGAMLELGDASSKFHHEIGKYAREAGIECLIVLGEVTQPAAEAFGSEALYFSDQKLLQENFPALESNHTIWVKGSRDASLENVVEWLAAEETG